MNDELIQINEEIEKTRDSIKQLRTIVLAQRKDLRYEIGDLFAESRHPFYKVFLIPGKLAKMRREYRVSKTEAKIEDEDYNDSDFELANKYLKELKNVKNQLEFYSKLGAHDLRYCVGTQVLSALNQPIKFLGLPVSLVKLYKKKKNVSMKLGKIEGIDEAVLFIATNGAGLGHLTRCLAIARQLKRVRPDVEIIFLTTSLALSVVNKEGFLSYCIPSKMLIDGISAQQWNAMLKTQLSQIMSLYGFKAVVFDGATPYASISAAMAKGEAVKIWTKRGGEKTAEIAEARRKMEDQFDLVIIPGEAGQSVPKDDQKHRYVNSILYLDKEELWTREDVRTYLKIPKDKKAVYIQLGAGNINDTDSDLGLIVHELRKRDDIVMIIGESLIGKEMKIIEEDIIIIKDYPNSKFFNGFDFAISAVGYNSFHEMVYNCLPAIFLPNMNTKTDDQYGRAMIAENGGAGRVITELTAETFNQCVDDMCDEEKNAAMRKAAAKIMDVNGAIEAANVIVEAMK